MLDARIALPEQLQSPDAERLHVQQWLVPNARGVVQTLHGLGEHQGVFKSLASVLNGAGWSVVGIDHRGHGQSSGERGVIPDPLQLLHDQARLHDLISASHRHLPHVMLGASMGGLLAARFAAAAVQAQGSSPSAPDWWRPLDGIILIAPALSVQLPAPQQATLSVLSKLVPDLPVTLSYLQTWGNSDPEVLQAKQSDPLIHTRLTPRVCQFMLQTARTVFEHTTQWRTPTLMACSRTDRLVPVNACERFMAEVPSQVLSTKVYPNMAHDLLHEPCQENLHALIVDWLNTLIASRTTKAGG